jgi:hypothetical protein
VDCLNQLAVFHHVLPHHDPVVVVIEFKETNTIDDRIFGDSTHQPSDFDAALNNVLGDSLYRPGDLLKRCPGQSTLRACVKANGWPSLNEARGKFIFAAMGNWDHAGTSKKANGLDWADYANTDMHNAAAFPMESPWRTCGIDTPKARLAVAVANSPLIQIQTGGPAVASNYDPALNVVTSDKCYNDGDAPLLFASKSRLLARIGMGYPGHGLGAGDDSYRMDWQALAATHNYSLVQTDHPWYVYDNRGPAYPHRPRDKSAPAPLEPGFRIAFLQQGAAAGGRGSLPLLNSTDKTGAVRVNTTVALTRPATKASYPNTRHPRGLGCITAYGANRDQDYIRVCRTTKDGENAAIIVDAVVQGKSIAHDEVGSAGQSAGDYGELIRLDLDAGRTCATAYSTGHLSGGQPQWTAIGQTHCVSKDTTLSVGLEAEAGDVLFVDTHVYVGGQNGTNSGWQEVGVSLSSAQGGNSYKIVDPADPSSIPLFVSDDSHIGKEDTYLRGYGTVPKCAPGMDYDAGLCYQQCKAGYHSVGPVCWGTCAAGYTDDGGTCRKDAIVQTKPSYTRGAGTVPSSCPNQEKDGALCYPFCKAGYHGAGPVCWQNCPDGYTDDGATCRRDASIISSNNSKCPWYDKCGLVTAKGCSTCPAGYKNDGCTCRRDVDIFGKSSYTRGAGSSMSCNTNQDYDTGLCYNKCNTGYHGVGPVCWGTCPAGFKDDGGTCRKDVEIVTKPSYTRGAGTVPDDCYGEEFNAGLCYAQCGDGFNASGVQCLASCPAAYNTQGDICVKK